MSSTTPSDRRSAAPSSPDGATASAPDAIARAAQKRRTRRAGMNTAFRSIKAQHFAERTRMERVADTLTGAAGSTTFLLGHGVWFAGWILYNSGTFGNRPFDEFPFGLLTMIVSLEAIFLSIFVLMAQRRESAIAELREELTLQVNLRMEEEVTKTLQLVAGLYTRLGHKMGQDPELELMLQPLDPKRIEEELIEQIASVQRRPATTAGR